MQRRTLLQVAAAVAAPGALLPAAVAAPDAADALATAPLTVALAWRGATEDSAHHVGSWRVDPAAGTLEPVWAQRLPSRPHGLFVEDDESLLVVAMRPGRWLMRLDRAGRVMTQLDIADEALPRRFDGHVIADAARGLVFTVETDRRRFTGLVGVRDARTLRKLDEWATHGVDPHQLLLDRDGHLVVANGGLWRTPEGQKRDLDRMDPSLVQLDGRSGALRAQWRLPDPRLSIRHLAWASGDDDAATMGVALQAEHDDPADRAAAPLLALYDGRSLRVVPRRADDSAAGYAGDIAAPAGRNFVVSAQRAGQALRWQKDVEDVEDTWQTIARLHDVCGLAAVPGRDDAALVVTGARGLGLWHPQRPGRLFGWPEPIAVDNHVVVV